MLRDADPDRDGDACAAIYRPYVDDSATSFEEVAPDAAAMAERMRTVTATHPWIVAERDGAVVGFAYAGPHRARVAYRWAADVSIYVAAAAQGEGRGRTLYTTLFDLLRRQGIVNACAGITLPNPASVALHEALGFRRVGVYAAIGFKYGEWRDVGWWHLRLTEPAPGVPPDPGPPVRLADHG